MSIQAAQNTYTITKATEYVQIVKSNLLITAMFRSNLFGNKLFAIALSRLVPVGDHLEATIQPSEIKQLLDTDNNIYKKLKATAGLLMQYVVTIEDGKGNFTKFVMMPSVRYENQKLHIEFHSLLTPYISRLQGSYTKFELATLLLFSSNEAYRLYEILKKEAYRLNDETDEVPVTYDIDQLRCMLSLVNTEKIDVQAALKKGMTWEDIVWKSIKKNDRQYDRYDSFRARILDPAQKEIAEKCDIAFDYKVEKEAHGKVRRITFLIRKNNPNEDERKKIEERAQHINQIQEDMAERMGYDDFIRDMDSMGISCAYRITPDEYRKLFLMSGGKQKELSRLASMYLTSVDIDDPGAYLMTAISAHQKPEDATHTSHTFAQTPDAPVVNQEDSIARSVWMSYRSSPDAERFAQAYKYRNVAEMELDLPPELLAEMYIDGKKRALF